VRLAPRSRGADASEVYYQCEESKSWFSLPIEFLRANRVLTDDEIERGLPKCASLSFAGAVTEESPLIAAFGDGKYTPEMRALQATRDLDPKGQTSSHHDEDLSGRNSPPTG
jgi:hypothetical protein